MATEGRVRELDGLRGLAILMVMSLHYVWPFMGHASDIVQRLVALLNSGVDLFFVVSGFLIGGILMAHADSKQYFRTFYVRRFAGIIPLYYVVLVAFVVARAVWGERISFVFTPSAPLLVDAAFLQNFWMVAQLTFGASFLQVTWSLAIEEQFYLTLPTLVRWQPLPRLKLWLYAALIGAPLLRFLWYGWNPEQANIAAYVMMPCRADALAAGALLALLLRPGEALVERRIPGLAGASIMLVLATAKLSQYATRGLIQTCEALLYASLLLAAVQPGESLYKRILRNPVLRQFGILCYGIYLLHVPVLHLMSMLHLGLWLPPLAFAVTFLLASLSWRFLEQPLIRWGHQYRY